MLYGVRDGGIFRNHGKFAPVLPSPVGEALTGWVLGKEASDLEERFYRAGKADGRTRRLVFRRIFGAPSRSMYGAIELDFLVWAGSMYAVQIDAERFHQTAAAINRDSRQDERLVLILRYYNIDRIHRIQGKHLQTQAKAQATWEQLLSGRIFTKWS